MTSSHPDGLTPFEQAMYTYITNPDSELPNPIPFFTQEPVFFASTHGPRNVEEAELIRDVPEFVELLGELWEEEPPAAEVLERFSETEAGRDILAATGRAASRDATTPDTAFTVTDVVVDDLLSDIYLHLITEEAKAMPGLRSDTDEFMVPTWVFESSTSPRVHLEITESTNLDTGEPELLVELTDPAAMSHESSGWRLTLTFQDGTEVSVRGLEVFEAGAVWEVPTDRDPGHIVGIRLDNPTSDESR